MSKYTNNPDWDDVVPIEQDDGGPNPLAAIAYTEDYSEAMGYLRAVMAANEMSERALDLTEDIIVMNPAHYTIWLYRARILLALQSNLRHEMFWLNAVALVHPKNYQIWHHRQFLINHINSPDDEISFINRMLRLDAKNYHVWSYRQWLVRHFGLWQTKQLNGRNEQYLDQDEDEQDDDDDNAPQLNDQNAATTISGLSASAPASETTELEETELFIAADVRNNSAWNHRFFLVSHVPDTPESSNAVVTSAVSHAPSQGPQLKAAQMSRNAYAQEMSFTKAQIRLAPQNQSPWNYIRGIVELYHGKGNISDLETFCGEFADLSNSGGGTQSEGEKVTSSHALALLAEIWAAKNEKTLADAALRLLIEKYDPVRANYWEYLRGRWATPGRDTGGGAGGETVAAAVSVQQKA